MSLPRPVIAGNWKMNVGPTRVAAYFQEFLRVIDSRRAPTLAFFPPSISLAAARDALPPEAGIELGVQNVHWEEAGAFTGEISAPMAAEAGASLVLVGHSERRHVFGETDAQTTRKVSATLAAGLTPMLCVGETLDDRENGTAFQVVQRQLTTGLEPILDSSHSERLLIAYEPVWAIGTGRTASPQDASEMHAFLRELLERRLGPGAAAIPLLYGGSVKADNAATLLAAPHLDGLLVGGASLDPTTFARICLAGA
jgi:triosephosphate isomerase (TIM)